MPKKSVVQLMKERNGYVKDSEKYRNLCRLQSSIQLSSTTLFLTVWSSRKNFLELLPALDSGKARQLHISHPYEQLQQLSRDCFPLLASSRAIAAAENELMIEVNRDFLKFV